MKSTEVFELINKHGDDALAILSKLGGYYQCPKDAKTGKRLGPLVAYTARYSESGRTKRKHYVGDVYVDFSTAEQYPLIIQHFANMLAKRIPRTVLEDIDIFCAPQMGGVSIGQMLAYMTGKRFAYVEKIITRMATSTLDEESEFQFKRHSILSGERVCIIDDVLNNFSTAKKMIRVVEKHKGTMVGITGLLNRSLKYDQVFPYRDGELPITSLVRKPIDEYRQSDSEVAEDILTKNVIQKPKNERQKLIAVMQKVK